MYGRRNNYNNFGCLGCLGGCLLTFIVLPITIIINLINSLFKNNNSSKSDYGNYKNDNESYKNESYKKDKSFMIESSSPIKEGKRVSKRQVKDVIDYEEKIKKKNRNE